VKRQRLEDRHVEIRLRHVLEPLLRRSRSERGSAPSTRQTSKSELGAASPRARLPKRSTASTSGSVLARTTRRETAGGAAHDTWAAEGWSNRAQRFAPSVGVRMTLE